MSNNAEKEYIWTDNDFSRRIIWEAYLGFGEFFSQYLVLKSLNKNVKNPLIKASLKKYSINFYFEVKHLIPVFVAKNKDDIGIRQEDWQTYEQVIKKEHYDDSDLLFIKEFQSSFLHYSGMKNPVLKKDIRTNYEKAREKFGIE